MRLMTWRALFISPYATVGDEKQRAARLKETSA